MCRLQDIDEYLCQAKDKSYDTLVHFGRKGLNVAAAAAVMAASKVVLSPGISAALSSRRLVVHPVVPFLFVCEML